MPVYVNTDVAAYVDSIGLHGWADEVDLDGTADLKDFTTYASGKWRIRKVGLASYSLGVNGFQDNAAGGPEATFPVAGLGTINTFTVAPQNLAASVGDAVFIGQGPLRTATPGPKGAVGDEARFELGWASTGPLVRGKVLHPEAARTATGNGTTTTFTAPTASQALYASFHVLSVSGAGTITFTVQTDDNSGMTTPTTRITSSAFAAVGGGFGSLAGSLAGETHIRVAYTIAGFTSVTFVVAAGVA